MRARDDWEIVYTSVRGKSHVDTGIPNQDALFVERSTDGSIFVVAISDGAGSAAQAEKGAKHFSTTIGKGLLSLARLVHAREIEGNNPGLIADRILTIIASARQQLLADHANLRDFAANLMAIVIGPEWGVRVHLGDAILMKSSFAKDATGKLDYFSDLWMTKQDRAEYANETHFLTQYDWYLHLSWGFLDPSGPEDLYVLMSDGAGDIALDYLPGGQDRKIFRGFMAPVVNQVLIAPTDQRNKILDSVLADPQTFRLTGDDKTLVLVLRSRCFDHAESEPLIEEIQAPPATSASAPEVLAGAVLSASDTASTSAKNRRPPSSSATAVGSPAASLPIAPAPVAVTPKASSLRNPSASDSHPPLSLQEKEPSNKTKPQKIKSDTPKKTTKKNGKFSWSIAGFALIAAISVTSLLVAIQAYRNFDLKSQDQQQPEQKSPTRTPNPSRSQPQSATKNAISLPISPPTQAEGEDSPRLDAATNPGASGIAPIASSAKSVQPALVTEDEGALSGGIADEIPPGDTAANGMDTNSKR